MDGFHVARRSTLASCHFPTVAISFVVSALLTPRVLAQDAPNTLQTSAVPPTSIAPSATSLSPSSISATSTPTPSNSTNNNNNNEDRRPHGFNYFFLVIAISVLFFSLLLCYTVRRRRIKAATMRMQHARALSEDVGGFRSPRYGRGWGWPADGDRNTPPPGLGLRGGRGRRRGEQVEGLNERGEAPPPYSGVGSKPPSLRSWDGMSGRCESRAESAYTVNRRPSQDVEMGDMARPRQDAYEPPRAHWRPQERGEPPAYPAESATSGTTGQQAASPEMTTVSRPEPAVTRP